ncbi:GDP-D-mannose 4,6-dehydratase 1 [Actinidia rufa]|uniref:GDP-D-mannose 4,6-dehydratase 1 n=1 Tax=Actinidia rufa TaxID=165716 RepID=A0A7J0END1_9ERIC|nr:GDP-D-mannose 4,6-dehydratase 1 [Actinidia rufa]
MSIILLLDSEYMAKTRRPNPYQKQPSPRRGQRRRSPGVTKAQDSTGHGHHRSGRVVPDRIPLEQGLRGPRSDSTVVELQHPADQSHLHRPPQRPQGPDEATLRRSHRRILPPELARHYPPPTRSTTSQPSPTSQYPSRSPTTPQTSSPPAPSDSSRPSDPTSPPPAAPTSATTKPDHLKCSDPPRLPSPNRPHSTPDLPTPPPNAPPTGTPSTTARPTGSSPATAFSSTTNHPGAASRDWGFAGDYVEAMWLMMQQETPDDYVVATEESHTVQEFLEVAFGYVGLNWKDHVVIDKRYFRPTEVDNLKGDASKAKQVLGWKPKVGFEQLVKMMVDEDIELANREKVLVDAGLHGCSATTLIQSNCGPIDSVFEIYKFDYKSYKRLQKPDVIFGHSERTAKVAFAEPLREPDPEVMAQVKSVFVDGFPPHWDEDNVWEQFKSYGEIVRIMLARNLSTARRRDYGFVDFTAHEAAVACVEGINNAEFVDGNSKTKVRAKLSNTLPKSQAIKGGMCGGFRIGCGGAGSFSKSGQTFNVAGLSINVAVVKIGGWVLHVNMTSDVGTFSPFSPLWQQRIPKTTIVLVGIGDVDLRFPVEGKEALSFESRSSSKTPKIEGKEVRRRGRSPRRNDQVPRHREESTTQKIRDLDAKIDAINTGTSAPVDALIRQTEPPFTERIMRTRVSSKFKLPTQLGVYEWEDRSYGPPAFRTRA